MPVSEIVTRAECPDGTVPQTVPHAGHGVPAKPTPGLSAHAQALWLASVRYRLLADQLARDSVGARP